LSRAGAPCQRTRGLDLGLHVSQLVLNRLKARDRTTKGGAFLGVAGRQLERCLSDSDCLGGDRDTATVQGGERDAHAPSRFTEPLGGSVVEAEIGRGG
jgi:hypothetical protein